MNKTLLVYVRNTVIFMVVWNVVVAVFRRPYVFDVWKHIVFPLIIAPLFTYFESRHNAIMDKLVDDPSKKKKWDPYNHD